MNVKLRRNTSMLCTTATIDACMYKKWIQYDTEFLTVNDICISLDTDGSQ
jgi:hypothetical protein